MKKHRITLSTVLLVLALGTLASQFAQDASTGAEKPDAERRASMLGLVRTINTIEVTHLYKYGSYESWPILVAQHQQDFDAWLKRFYHSDEPNVRFGDMPEILPGWNLRLNVQTDGKGYAALSDERGIIRECKYLQ